MLNLDRKLEQSTLRLSGNTESITLPESSAALNLTVVRGTDIRYMYT